MNLEIGYREDGIIWVTASTSVPDAKGAEAYAGANWRVLAPAFLAPTGVWLNSKDAEWVVCDADTQDARLGWSLVDIEAEMIFDYELGEDIPNPHYSGVDPQVEEDARRARGARDRRAAERRTNLDELTRQSEELKDGYR